jgi:outer membrane protein OmpA-like peptidoglycan-associated protein
MRTISTCCLLAAALLLAKPAQGQTAEDDLQTVLQKLNAGESVENMTIQLGDINFATGTANLEPGAKTYLNKVAKLLKLATNINLFVKGHADNTGTAAVNEKLSTDRATAVVNYLILQNIDAGRFEAKGFGSEVPVADNASPEGRAKNRRVELEILKKESVKTIQDLIVLLNGEHIGATVTSYDKQQISYRQFTEGTARQISTRQVEKIVFADGGVIYFNLPEGSADSHPNAPFKFRPFAESAAFHKGQFVLGAGIGAGNNIGIGYKDNNISMPPLWLVLEFPLKHNIGVGLAAGMMRWSPKSAEGDAFSYLAVSPRMAYHLNLTKPLDLYAGVSLTVRSVSLAAERQGAEPFRLRNTKPGIAWFTGIRYYFNQVLGVYGEYGGDHVSCARLGLAFRFGK